MGATRLRHAQRIQQVPDDLLNSIKARFTRAAAVEQRGLDQFEVGRVGQQPHKAKYYSLTPAGPQAAHSEAESWERMAAVIARLLQAEGVVKMHGLRVFALRLLGLFGRQRNERKS